MQFDVVKKNLNDAMNKALESLKHQLSKVRTGRASANVLDGLTVDYYGVPSPLKQVAQVSTPEARILQIQPFDKTMIAAIEKSILAANLGITPSNDGNLIRVIFPAMTEDKRKIQVKEIKKFGEEAKVATPKFRRDQNEIVKKAEKSSDISEDQSKKHQEEIQKITDNFIAQIDKLVESKEKEVMTI